MDKEAADKFAYEIDNALMNRDTRKPVRKIVDDVVAPAAGMALGAGAAAVKAVGNLQPVSRLKQI